MHFYSFTCLALLVCSFCFGQQANVNERTPKVQSTTIPDFSLYVIPDSTEFNSSKMDMSGYILIKFFRPDCEYCQEEVKKLLAYQDRLDFLQIVWIAPKDVSIAALNEFSMEYELEKLNNIAVGKLIGSYLWRHFEVASIPYSALYKDNVLVKEFRTTVQAQELLKLNKTKN